MTILDLATGAVTFDDLSIGRTSRVSDFEKFVTRQAFTNDSSDALLGVGSHGANGAVWGVGVRLRNGRVQQLWLQSLTADGVLPDVWDLANEERRQKAQDDFLKQLCANSRGRIAHRGTCLEWEFDWGSASSTLDLKGVQALIVITYTI
jgi:hypothetical protein